MSFTDILGPAAIGAGALIGGPVGAGLAMGGFGYMGAQSTNQQNADNAASANAFSAEQYATRYQTTVKDMEAAGLNPMLAYSSGVGSAPTGQMVQFQNPALSGIQGFQTGASGIKDLSSANQAESLSRQADATVDKIKAETKNIPVEGDRLKYTIQLLAEQAAKTAQETESQVAVRQQIAATIQKLKAETSLLNFDVDAAKNLDNIGAQSRQFKIIVDLIKAVK